MGKAAWLSRRSVKESEYTLSEIPGSQQRRENLLGSILEKEEWLTRQQVLAVLAKQRLFKEAGRAVAFGEIALEMGFLSHEQMLEALTLQRKIAVAPGGRKRLGAYLMEAGAVRPSQLAAALDEQTRSPGKKLGEILVERDLVKLAVLNVFLKLQASGIEDMKKTAIMKQGNTLS